MRNRAKKSRKGRASERHERVSTMREIERTTAEIDVDKREKDWYQQTVDDV